MPGYNFHQHAALVMAHPDDEVLWASSVLPKVSRVILCFEAVGSQPDWTSGRRLSLARYPIPQVTQLGLQESEVFNCAYWPDPEETDYGLKVHPYSWAMPGFSQSRYRENYTRLMAELRKSLAGCSSVITHNPWGEYGHEEHVQVFRAVAALQTEMGFELWVNCYVSNRNYHLMTRHFPNLDANDCCLLPTDPALGGRLKALYAQHGCWTWYDDYQWPLQECFCRYTSRTPPSSPTKFGTSITFNMLWIKDRHIRRGPKWSHFLMLTRHVFRRTRTLR